MNRILLGHVIPLLLLGFGFSAAPAETSVAPSVVIVHAGMRPGTTLMDVMFRVDDPDDATVKVRALAFKDGVRSFANIIRPVTFVEGTGVTIGDAIQANLTHALVWDVGADWNIDLGQAKFEILAMDGRGLLSFDWITIPAAGGYPQVTVSTNSPSNTELLNALFWQYASGDPGLSLTNGVLSGNSNSGVFSGLSLASGTTLKEFTAPFILKRMNLAIAKPEEKAQVIAARQQVASGWLAANRPYSGFTRIVGWGTNIAGSLTTPQNLSGVTAVRSGTHNCSVALKSDGTVVAWGENWYGQTAVPVGLSNVTAISTGRSWSLALKSNGTVVAWGAQGDENHGQASPPSELTGVVEIAAAPDGFHSLALKGDGTVVGWGDNSYGQATPPVGLSNVTAIAAGGFNSLALKSDGTVVAWGLPSVATNVPPGLTGVIAIALSSHALALKSNGTVVSWGWNSYGQTNVPGGLAGVTAISAGHGHSLALKNDGTVVGWGQNTDGQATPPPGLSNVIAVSAGQWHSLALVGEGP